MGRVIQLGIVFATALVGFLLGLHAQFSEGVSTTTFILVGLLLLLAVGSTTLSVWLAGPRPDAHGQEEDALRVAEEMAEHLARHDALTGLPNRSVFLERLDQAVSGGRRGDRGAAVLCLDLCDFKAVNGTLGYAAGDLLLRHMSARLLATLRETDILARMGPDEFGIIQAELETPEAAARLCERLLAAMAEPFDLFGQSTYVRANIGVALFPTDERDPEDLLKQAGQALTRAKADGVQTFRFFEGTMDSELRQRKALERDLHYALERHELEVHYQPQIDLRTRAMAGVEALLRWHHPKHGLIMPDRFIPLAEDSGMILPIGTWVLEQACQQARQWQAMGLPQLRISVNLSPIQFRDPDLAGSVRAILDHTGLSPDRLELEITERVLMEDTEINLATLRELKLLGVKISVDDFGVGHSGLNYLRRFPFDEIKVDRSFVAALGEDPSATAIVRATLSLGHSLGLDAVAEGVETARQLALLDAEGCRLAQGYYFSPPVHPREITAMVKAAVDSGVESAAMAADARGGGS
jgi:diguanylate cyclase (GGDEF)-like protein